MIDSDWKNKYHTLLAEFEMLKQNLNDINIQLSNVLGENRKLKICYESLEEANKKINEYQKEITELKDLLELAQKFETAQRLREYLSETRIINKASRLVDTLTESDDILSAVKDKNRERINYVSEYLDIKVADSIFENENITINYSEKIQSELEDKIQLIKNENEEFALEEKFNDKTLSKYFTLIHEDNCYRVDQYIGFDDVTLLIPKFYNGKPIIKLASDLFSKCENLRKLFIYAPISIVPSNLCSNCKNLEYVHLPDTITNIEPCTFNQCSALKDIELPQNVVSIGGNAFSSTSLSQIDLPTDLKTLSVGWFGTFASCKLLQTVITHSRLETIESYCFSNCENLQKIVLCEGLIEIGDNAFCNCKMLTEIVIPRSVNKIGINAFSISRIVQPDRRYNPDTSYSNNEDIIIKCYAGSFAQTWARGKFKIESAD